MTANATNVVYPQFGNHHVVVPGEYTNEEKQFLAFDAVRDLTHRSVIGKMAGEYLLKLIEAGEIEDPRGTEAERDFDLVIEAIHSMLMRLQGHNHPLQNFADQCIVVTDEEGGFEFVAPNTAIEITLEPETEE